MCVLQGRVQRYIRLHIIDRECRIPHAGPFIAWRMNDQIYRVGIMEEYPLENIVTIFICGYKACTKSRSRGRIGMMFARYDCPSDRRTRNHICDLPVDISPAQSAGIVCAFQRGLGGGLFPGFKR